MQNESVKVSVIIPCYNCERWIGKCIEALENQTRKDFEVICVDDCSTDNTKEVLSRIKDASSLDIKIIYNEHNMGPGESRNKAIVNSSGDWLAFCDSDDWYDRRFIEKMLLTALNTSSDIVMCEYRKVFESGRDDIDVNYLHGIKEDVTVEELINYSKDSLCFLFVNKLLFENFSIPDLRNGEDMAIVPCLESYAKKIACVTQPLYNYCMRPHSASNNIQSRKVYKALLKAFAFTEEHINPEYKDTLEFLGIKNVLYGVMLNAFKVNADNSEMAEVLKQFENKYPNWNANGYMHTLSLSKRVFLFCIKRRLFFPCRFFATIHKKLSM